MKPFAAILLTLTALQFTSCSDSDEGGSVTLYQDIVTFAANRGDSIYFDFQVVDDSPLVRLSAKGNINEDKTPTGTRLFITYSPVDERPYGQSGPIMLRGASRMYDLKATEAPAEKPETEPIAVTSLWRSGRYINMIAQIPFTEKRSFNMYFDPASLQTPTAVLYITTMSTLGDAPGYMTRTAASFDISEIWDRPDITAVEVHVDNSENPNRNIFIFKK